MGSRVEKKTTTKNPNRTKKVFVIEICILSALVAVSADGAGNTGGLDFGELPGNDGLLGKGGVEGFTSSLPQLLQKILQLLLPLTILLLLGIL